MGEDTALEELPPSAKLVHKVLEYEGAMDTAEIVDKTDLHYRTVSEGLKRLRNAGLVTKEPDVGDPRKNLYRVASE